MEDWVWWWTFSKFLWESNELGEHYFKVDQQIKCQTFFQFICLVNNSGTQLDPFFKSLSSNQIVWPLIEEDGWSLSQCHQDIKRSLENHLLQQRSRYISIQIYLELLRDVKYSWRNISESDQNIFPTGDQTKRIIVTIQLRDRAVVANTTWHLIDSVRQ